jgi:hypothetical protein
LHEEVDLEQTRQEWPSHSTHKEAFMALLVLDSVISSSDTQVKK